MENIISHKNYPKVSKYVAAWKKLIDFCNSGNGNTEIKSMNWGYYETAEQERKNFQTALHRRICSRGGINPDLTNRQEIYAHNLLEDSKTLKDIYNHRRPAYRRFLTAKFQEKYGTLLKDWLENYE